jgi:hypothetical protein
MTNTRRFLLFAGVTAAALAAQGFWLATVQPQESTLLAVNQLNGGAEASSQLLAWQWLHQIPLHFAEIVMWLTGAWCIAPLLRRTWRSINALRAQSIRWFAIVISAIALSGCMRAYDKPENTLFTFPLNTSSASR